MSPAAASRFATVALVFALYTATMCRWIGAGDTAIVVWNMYGPILSSHVNNHAAMVGIGHLLIDWLPWGSEAWRANWFSVIFSTTYLGIFHALASRSIRDPFHTALATFVVAVSHSVWWHATIVENYALNGVFLLTVTWLLTRDHETGDIRWMYTGAVVAGLAVLNHAQMGFLAPVLGMYALVRDGWKPWLVLKRWVLLALLWLVGLFPFLGLMYRNISRGFDREVVVKNAMGSYFTEIMFDLRLHEIGTIFWREILVQFPSPVLLCLPFGIWFAFRKNERWKVNAALAAGFAINSGFFMLYHTWDRFAFLLPSYVILLLWLTEAWGVALRWADEKKPALRWAIVGLAVVCIAMPPMVYRELPRLGRAGVFWHGRFSSNAQWNTHDVATYLANPDKSGWNDLHRVNMLLIENIPERATIIDDDGRNHYTLELYFQKVRRQRTDIRSVLVNAWGFEGWGQDKEKLPKRILKWREQAPVYSMTLMPPHRSWISALSEEGVGPVPVYLADDVWIYEYTDRPRGAAAPFIWELHTGIRLKGTYQMLTHHFGPEDDSQVRIRHKKVEEGEEYAVTLTYKGPGGERIVEEHTLDPGERTVRPMPEQVRSVVGRWEVEVAVDDQVDTFIRFTNEPDPVDRRYR